MAEGDLDATQARNRAQQMIYDMMLDKIRQDTFPSPTMMDAVESHMTEEQLPDYLGVLMEKIDGSRFPSMDMVRRVIELT